jgi:hypothetical protein
MSLFEILSADIFPEVCPPDQTSMLGLLRSTSKKFKTEIDNMSLEVHIEIKSFNIDDIIKNIKEISKNYTITKIKFSKSNTILMFINLDIICELCPFLTHLDLGSNNFISYSLKEFKTNLPKCNVIQYMFSYNCKRVKETREYTFGTTYYYELRADIEILLKVVQQNDIQFNDFPSMELRDDREIVLVAVQQDKIPLVAVQQDKIPLKTKQAYKVRDHETKELRKRFRTNKSQYNTNALNQRYQKKY